MIRFFKTAALVLALTGSTVLTASDANAASVGMAEWSVAVHGSGLVHSVNRDDAAVVGGLELDIGYGIAPRFRIEGVGLAMFELDNTDLRQYMIGARPLVRLGGLLGDIELGATVYAALGGSVNDTRPSVVFGPHLRYTFLLLSVFYEPLFFTSQDFSAVGAGVAEGNSAALIGGSEFFPLRFGVGVQF